MTCIMSCSEQNVWFPSHAYKFCNFKLKRKYLISWTKNPWCYKKIDILINSLYVFIIEPVFIFFPISIYIICKYLEIHTQDTLKILLLLSLIVLEKSILNAITCAAFHTQSHRYQWLRMKHGFYWYIWIEFLCVFAIKDNENRSYL